MSLAVQALVALATIGGIAIGVLFYYHKQTFAVWTTFISVVAVTLAVCLQWQEGIWKKEEEAAKKAAAVTPSVKFEAYLRQPDPPYPPGVIIGGIEWKKDYAEVRLDVINGRVPIQNLVFEVALDVDNARKTIDTNIIGVGQLSEFPGVTWFSSGGPPSMALGVVDEKGNKVTVPAEKGVTGGLIKVVSLFSLKYRIHCTNLLDNVVLKLVIAGARPGAKAAPRKITVWGSYEASGVNGVQRYSFDNSYPLGKS